MVELIKKRRFYILSLLFFFAFSLSAFAQRTIKGIVLDESNMPLPGASVSVKGTSNGVSTDFDGNFSIAVSNEAKMFSITYLGYKTKEVAITGNNITVSLEVEANALDEIVVVGYGTQRKSDLVNAVATADLEKATLSPTSDVTEMLRGRIAGLQVSVGSGTLRPGGAAANIIFRGEGSLSGDVSAIYVVDGIIRDDGIADIDQDDIASMEFLKDASAQAIYGSRASNGVVLITTKRGKNKKIQVSYHGYTTTKTIERNFDVFSGQELADLRREANRADDGTYSPDDAIFSDIELEALNNNQFVDWEEELLRSGVVNSQALSVSGGTEITKVFGSVNYFKETGLIPNSNYTRKTLRLNVDQKISDKVSVSFDLNLLNSDTDKAAGVNVISTSPIAKPYNDDGSLSRFPYGDEIGVSPLWNLREQNEDIKGNDFVVNITPSWQILENLQYQLKTNFTRRTYERGKYQSILSGAADDVNGRATIESQLKESYLLENILNYNKEINEDHKFNVTLVHSVQENKRSRTTSVGEGFVSDSQGYDGIADYTGESSISRLKTQSSLVGLMARLRYSLMDKYLLNFTARNDASSVNSADNKWRSSFGGSFAWKMHNEGFLENVDAIRELKFRASYGALTNSLGTTLSSVARADGNNYIFNESTESGFGTLSTLPNPNLRSEKVTTFNLGLDFSIFDNILTGNINYYDARTTDLLLNRPVPSITGFADTYTNGGELQNTGVELSLTANIISNDVFRWSVSSNWSKNKNKLLSLYDDGDGVAILEDTRSGNQKYVGYAINSFKAYRFDGIWQEGEDLANAPQSNPDNLIKQPNLRAGDIRVADLNGDGKITEEDREVIETTPDWFGSFSTNFEYKGFELLVDFYAVQGIRKSNSILTDANSGAYRQGVLNGVKVPYYTPENPSTTYPIPTLGSAPQYLNSLAISDASYVRLRTLSLGYSLPGDLLDRLGLDQVKLYITGANLFTQTDYIGYSPEVDIRTAGNTGDSGYPDAKSYTFGLRLKF
ncbi:SusC/RagA family TonB-linked outer membrane protein [Polaribacter sp. L3A8]|uniref:SusC/RagA family TonB-linked outer membrane protein n=1 Tax=Polaribacter sp. L3A8 TaxID=2686361 RepID=UPI00131E5637|nr:TonB-dependent receptor [Polaribacter sp. L3A8]